jgi:hypothetical protein
MKGVGKRHKYKEFEEGVQGKMAALRLGFPAFV